MKLYKHILPLALAAALATACNEGIDPISYVAPGEDATAPQVKITYPSEGTKLQVPELVTSVDIQFEVTDDIELQSISVLIDNSEITSYSIFKDYRRLKTNYLFSNVTNGAHVLAIKATDKTGKVTTGTVNFEKKPPYVPLFDGEVAYMPFDGDYVEKISFAAATKAGNPTFYGSGLKGLNAYMGAADSYLTIPTTAIQGTSFSAAFWYKVNAAPDRSGILSASPGGEDRTKGFRLFREGDAASQRIKMNVGTGDGETWNDGDVLTAPGTEWVHIAVTVDETSCTIYFNGAIARQVANTGISWTGCNVLSIGSGAPDFTYWGHNSDLSGIDELRLFNKAISQAEIQQIIANDSPYVPKYDGEVFYMPFEGKYLDLVSMDEATAEGSPDFTEGHSGQAYAGATDSYITFPLDGLKSSEFSGTFWYKVNATPDRSGIINASLAGEDRTKGIRLFREGDAVSQRIKINVGTGAGETWNDGGLIDAAGTDWVHIAFTVSGTKCTIYLNGELATEVANTGLDWTGCDALTIGSGAPNFTYWGHNADLSSYDELRLFNKALSQAEIQTIMNETK